MNPANDGLVLDALRNAEHDYREAFIVCDARAMAKAKRRVAQYRAMARSLGLIF
jgi:hypothetical protein